MGCTGVFNSYSQKVVSSKIKDLGNVFEVHIYSLSVFKPIRMPGENNTNLRDVISVCDNYMQIDKNSRLVSFKRVPKKKILGKKY